MRNFDELGALAWICDSNPLVLQELGQKYPEARRTRSVDDVLADGGGDWRRHRDARPRLTPILVRRALQAGKDVLVEKPLGLDVDEGAELVALRRAHESDPDGRPSALVPPGRPQAPRS